ncbi:MAG: hypothetical protein Q9168_002900 [Polycauliona sp. 1 TL-2023]
MRCNSHPIQSLHALVKLSMSRKALARHISTSLTLRPLQICSHIVVSQAFSRRTMATNIAKRLEGKTIVVTGASSGIGKSTALEFARTSPNNLKLILTARRLESLKALAEEIRNEVGPAVQVLPLKLDVSKPDEVRGFVAALPPDFQNIDVLVNNAGLVKGVAKAPDILEEDAETMISTNLTGLINMTQVGGPKQNPARRSLIVNEAVLQIFKKRDGGGRGDIINIGSIAGREGYPGGSIYCATKAAVRVFTEALRKELIATRIRVMEIDPGQVETEFSVVRFDGDKAKADAVYRQVPKFQEEYKAYNVTVAANR